MSNQPNMRVAIAKSKYKPPTYMNAYYLTPEWTKLRKEVCRMALWRCFYCGENGRMADHVLPRERGGRDALSNLVCACAKCNKLAGNKVFLGRETKKEWILKQRKRDP